MADWALPLRYLTNLHAACVLRLLLLLLLLLHTALQQAFCVGVRWGRLVRLLPLLPQHQPRPRRQIPVHFQHKVCKRKSSAASVSLIPFCWLLHQHSETPDKRAVLLRGCPSFEKSFCFTLCSQTVLFFFICPYNILTKAHHPFKISGTILKRF